MRCLAFVLVIGGFFVVSALPTYAQSPVPATPVAASAKGIDLSTPEKTTTTFLTSFFRSDLQTASLCVLGATYSESLMKYERGLKKSSVPSDFEFALDDLRMTQEGGKTTLRFRPMLAKSTTPMVSDVNTVTLVQDGTDWKIEVPNSEEVASSTSGGVSGTNLTQSLAILVRFPEIALQARTKARAVVSLSNVKQLALACLMLAQDYQGILRCDRKNFRAAVFPYTKNVEIFTSPMDPPGTQTYQFNSKLSNVDLYKIPHPESTVMIYEGYWGHPSFRNNDMAVIGFADGHARLVWRVNAGKLIWSPFAKKPVVKPTVKPLMKPKTV